MEFLLPRMLTAGSGARLRTQGRVVRVEPDGFAVLAEMSTSSLLHGAVTVRVSAESDAGRMKTVR